MAITIALPANGSGADATDATGYTTGSIDFVSGRVYVMVVDNSRGTSTATQPSVSGSTSGTWGTEGLFGATYDKSASSPVRRIRVLTFTATSTFSETLSISFGATTQTGCRWIVAEVSGADTDAPIVQAVENEGDAGTTASVSLAALADAANAVIGFFGCDSPSDAFTEGAGFTLLGQVSNASPNSSACCVYAIGDNAPSATMSTADWGGVAVEVAIAPAGGIAGTSTSLRQSRRRRR